MNLESEPVVQSLCNLLNVIAQQRNKPKEEDEEVISDMELDEKEQPGTQTGEKRRPRRKAPVGEMDVTTAEAGNREADENNESTPPAKVQATGGQTEPHPKAPPTLPTAKDE